MTRSMTRRWDIQQGQAAQGEVLDGQIAPRAEGVQRAMEEGEERRKHSCGASGDGAGRSKITRWTLADEQATRDTDARILPTPDRGVNHNA